MFEELKMNKLEVGVFIRQELLIRQDILNTPFTWQLKVMDNYLNMKTKKNR
jgi:hypothetical protein